MATRDEKTDASIKSDTDPIKTNHTDLINSVAALEARVVVLEAAVAALQALHP